MTNSESNRKEISDLFKNIFKAALGLVFYGFGVYLTIQANIGVAPWDAFHLGLASTIGIKYGTANIIVSLIVVVFDIVLREKIGIGMILDAILVGKAVDLFNFLKFIPPQHNIFIGILLMLAGIVIMGIAQEIYMKAALGCGPRDSLLVGLKRKLPKIPIGLISIVIMATVTFVGWLLGGQIGVGTLICAFIEGPIMQLDFKLLKFNPTAVEHRSIADSLKTVFKKNVSNR